MNQFVNLKIENGVLTGGLVGVQDNQYPVTVNFHNQNGSEDFSDLVDQSQEAIDNLTPEKFADLLEEISTELTESAYAQSDRELTAEDYARLREDLKLTTVNFYREDGISFVFKSKLEYPDMQIFCQVDEAMDLEDIAVE